MEKKTTLFIKLDTDREVRVEMTHVTAGLPAPNEQNRERGLSVRELEHVSKRLVERDYTTRSNF